MKKFNAVLQRDFEVQIEADSAELATKLVANIVAQFPRGTCKVLSLTAEDYVEPPVVGRIACPIDLSAARNAGLAKNVRKLTDEKPPEAA